MLTQTKPTQAERTEQQPKGLDFPEAKSVSTGASLENVFMNFSASDNNMFSQKLFKSEDSHLFCRNISKRLMNLRREIVQNANRVNNGLLNFLFQYLVINNIEFAEIEIFFSFLTPLIDVAPSHAAAN